MIDQWDVMGMRATVSHSVRITDFEVPPERMIGEPGAWTRRDPRTFTLAFAANHIGAAGAALEFATDWVQGAAQPLLFRDHAGARLARCRASCSRRDPRSGRLADLWDAGDYDPPNSVDPCPAPRQARRADLTQTAFDVCGARAAFRDLALERLYRDVRTFSLHYRDEQYMIQVGQAMLDRAFRAKGYAGASTFPESRA